MVIEKDEEYESEGLEDPVKRQYIPIRDYYIQIVKSCRVLTFESFDRKSRQELQKTAKALHRLARKVQEGRHWLSA